jgi:rhodanese-related sulfurtransferase
MNPIAMRTSAVLLSTAAAAAAAAAAVATLAGCNGPSINDTDITPVSRERLIELRSGADSTVLVDPRSAATYGRGHIPGAIHVPMPSMRRDDGRLAEAEVIVVYDGGWTDRLGLAAAKRLRRLDYTSVLDFRGGLEAWVSGGGQVSSTRPAPSGRPETDR